MRVLVLLSGLITAGTGLFCLFCYTYTFSDVAFIIGIVMMLSGMLLSIAYLISCRNKSGKMTETMLVEGMVTLLFGLAVLNNQVTDSLISIFFGTWMTLCGITRFAQSIYVSRFNPKDWSKIIPLAAISAVLGVVMMLPDLLVSVTSVILLGGAFLIDGLSIMVFFIYVKVSREEMAVGEARAKARYKAKQDEHKAAVAERDRLRNLSQSERKKEERRKAKEERLLEEQRQEEKRKRREQLRTAIKPEAERTLRFTEDQVEKLNRIDTGYRARVAKEKAIAAGIYEEPEEKIRKTDIVPAVRKKKSEKNAVQEQKKQNDSSVHQETAVQIKKDAFQEKAAAPAPAPLQDIVSNPVRDSAQARSAVQEKTDAPAPAPVQKAVSNPVRDSAQARSAMQEKTAAPASAPVQKTVSNPVRDSAQACSAVQEKAAAQTPAPVQKTVSNPVQDSAQTRSAVQAQQSPESQTSFSYSDIETSWSYDDFIKTEPAAEEKNVNSFLDSSFLSWAADFETDHKKSSVNSSGPEYKEYVKSDNAHLKSDVFDWTSVLGENSDSY